jgi:hypothetical protein
VRDLYGSPKSGSASRGSFHVTGFINNRHSMKSAIPQHGRKRKKKVDGRKIFEVPSRPGAARYTIQLARDRDNSKTILLKRKTTCL